MKKAQAIRRMIEKFDYTHEEMTAISGEPRSQINNILRLLKLDNRVQDYLKSGALSKAHGKILAGLVFEKQYYFAEKCIQEGLSIRALTRRLKKPDKIKTKASEKKM